MNHLQVRHFVHTFLDVVPTGYQENKQLLDPHLIFRIKLHQKLFISQQINLKSNKKLNTKPLQKGNLLTLATALKIKFQARSSEVSSQLSKKVCKKAKILKFGLVDQVLTFALTYTAISGLLWST